MRILYRPCLAFFGCLLFLMTLGCNQVPKGIMNKKTMENVLVETHLAEAIIEEYPFQYRSLSEKQQLLAGVLSKNGVTKAEFDSSLVYYSSHLSQYMKIYQKVNERLKDSDTYYSDRLAIYERTLLTPEGDSVNIWKRSSTILLDPALLSSVDIFEIKGDSNFKADDQLIWKMRFTNLPNDTVAFAYLTLGYQRSGDIIKTVTEMPVTNGWLSLTMDKLPQIANYESIFGSIAFISKNDSLVTPLFIDSISLMRYRYKELPKMSSDSIRIDSLSTDSIKKINQSIRKDSLKK